jgi:hypothetical protein
MHEILLLPLRSIFLLYCIKEVNRLCKRGNAYNPHVHVFVKLFLIEFFHLCTWCVRIY